MRMIIVGGGKVGKDLARIMIDRRYEVTLIEKDKLRCRKIADELDAQVLYGDGSDVNVLNAAGAKNADCIMAVTGSDQDNLITAQMGKKYFGARKVIARASDPRNIETFRILGIENAVSSTAIISNMIEQEADEMHMHLLASLNKGRASICSIKLQKNTVLDGKAIMNIKFPAGSLIISIVRENELIIPNGSTILQVGDEVIAVYEEREKKALTRLLSEIR